MHRTTLITLIFVLLFGQGFAQDVYFPSKEGMELEFAQLDARGKVTSYVLHQIKSIDKQDDNNFSVTYSISTFDNKHKPAISPFDITVGIKDGIVYFDGTSSLTALMENIKVEGNGLILPANLSVGQQLDDYSVKVDAMGITSNCTNIVVAAEEEITTDAGTFNTYRIDGDVNSKVMFIRVSGKISQWYAKGIGAVKTISYDKNGKAAQTTNLIRIKN